MAVNQETEESKVRKNTLPKSGTVTYHDILGTPLWRLCFVVVCSFSTFFSLRTPRRRVLREKRGRSARAPSQRARARIARFVRITQSHGVRKRKKTKNNKK